MTAPATIPRPDAAEILAAQGRLVALLDAGRVPGLVERLESSGTPHLCLFQGETADDLADSAPWLVELAPHDPLLRRYLDDRPLDWALWRRGAGLLLRSDLPLNALRRHFRRFLRIEMGADTFFFRFWQPDTALAYFGALHPDRLGRWLCPREGGQIEALLIPDPQNDALRVIERPANAATPDRDGTFKLEPQELEAIYTVRQQTDLARITALMATTFPATAAQQPAPDFDRAVRRSVARAAEFGIRQSDHAFRFAAWDIHSDGAFERRDPAGGLRAILEADHPETDKMRRLAERIAALSAAD